MKSLATVKNKSGRVDVLVSGLSNLLLQRLESKVQLQGLADGLMPIVEEEIRKFIPARKVLPKQYEKVADLIASKLKG